MNTLVRLAYYTVLLTFISTGCRTGYFSGTEQVTYVRIDDHLTGDLTAVDSLIRPYKVSLDSIMSEILLDNPTALVKARPDGTLCRWFASVFHAAAQGITDEKIDVTFQNYGGLRLPEVAAGIITVSTIYELMPFDNSIVFMKLSAGELQEFLDHIASSNGWPIYGASFTIADNTAVDVNVDGRSLSEEKTYLIALPDYVANGGGGPDFLTEHDRTDTGLMIRDVLIEHLRQEKAAGRDSVIIPPIAIKL